MGGKGGGGDSGEQFQPQHPVQMMEQEQAAKQAAAAQLGTPYQPPTPQELQDEQNKRMLQGRGTRQRADPSLDPNAIAGSGMGKDATLGDAAAESVAPTQGRPRRKGAAVAPPPDTGSV